MTLAPDRATEPDVYALQVRDKACTICVHVGCGGAVCRACGRERKNWVNAFVGGRSDNPERHETPEERTMHQWAESIAQQSRVLPKLSKFLQECLREKDGKVDSNLALGSKWGSKLRNLIDENYPQIGKQERIRRARQRPRVTISDGIPAAEVKCFAEDVNLEYDQGEDEPLVQDWELWRPPKLGLYLDISGEWRPDNPKTRGTVIQTCRPQVGPCPGNCQDCYFMGGRYYEPLDKPHVPDPAWVNHHGFIVRMNEGNDSNHQRDLVIQTANRYQHHFFNTRHPKIDFPGPVLVTVNGEDIDHSALWIGDYAAVDDNLEKLMAVRFRLNTWNVDLARRVIRRYGSREIPVLLTFMAYYTTLPQKPEDYETKRRTLNTYQIIKPEARKRLERELGVDQAMVRTCTTPYSHTCKDCNNCALLYLRWLGKKANTTTRSTL